MPRGINNVKKLLKRTRQNGKCVMTSKAGVLIVMIKSSSRSRDWIIMVSVVCSDDGSSELETTLF